MAELKTQPTRKSARRFLQGIEHAQRREDGLELLALFEEITGEKPVMWGDSIVGYGVYHYEQRNGQAARWPLTGFSPRKQNMTIYIMPGFERYGALLNRLGKHKTARSCLYINKLADVKPAVLRQLIERSVRDMKKRHGIT